MVQSVSGILSLVKVQDYNLWVTLNYLESEIYFWGPVVSLAKTGLRLKSNYIPS
jgi:hypothetical protein